jgi:hypothetical protein
MSTEKTTKKPGNFKKKQTRPEKGGKKKGRRREPGFAGPPLVLSKNPPAKPGAVTLPAP